MMIIVAVIVVVVAVVDVVGRRFFRYRVRRIALVQ